MDNNGWISVEERLPEEADEEYICYVQHPCGAGLVIALIFDGEVFGEEDQIIDWSEYVTD